MSSILSKAIIVCSHIASAFTYDDIGHWTVDSALCVGASTQSPKDITGAEAFEADMVPMKLLEYPLDVAIDRQIYITPSSHNSITFDVEFPEEHNVRMKVHGNDYTYAGVHAHTPSEHTLAGDFTDAEFHFVHTLDGGVGYAVVGFMVNFISESEPVDDSAIVVNWTNAKFPTECPNGSSFQEVNKDNSGMLCSNIPEGESFPEMDDEFERLYLTSGSGMYSFFGYEAGEENFKFIHYNGSLTTPPCTEEVQWFLADKVVNVRVGSDFDVSNYQEAWKREDGQTGNNRPVNPPADMYYHAQMDFSMATAGAGHGGSGTSCTCQGSIAPGCKKRCGGQTISINVNY